MREGEKEREVGGIDLLRCDNEVERLAQRATWLQRSCKLLRGGSTRKPIDNPELDGSSVLFVGANAQRSLMARLRRKVDS